jgi:hypothetical protein
MYIDYDGYFYPKVLFSLNELQFPDENGNSLTIILLNITGSDGFKYYQNYIDCKVLNFSGEKYYNQKEIYDWLCTFTYVKHNNKIYDIKNIYTNYNDERHIQRI